MSKEKELVLVDCDDTLVLYDNTYKAANPFGVYHGEPWNPNTKLIEKILAFHEDGASVTVWSGGGADYARLWGDRLFPDITTEAFSKLDMVEVAKIAESGIIVHMIDDQQSLLDTFKDIPNIHTYTWEEFVGEE